MGWVFTHRQTRLQLIARRIRSEQNAQRTRHCLGHTTRGNVLWTVWEITRFDGDRVRYIGCDLLRHEKGSGWGYTDMEENMSPPSCTCPLSFLTQVPVANEEWRREVSAYHARKTSIRKGCLLELSPGCQPRTVVVTSVYPLRGTHGGLTYGIPWKYIQIVISTHDA